MIRAHPFRTIVGTAAVAALAAVLACKRAQPGPPLPAMRDYTDLPTAFATELRARREAVVASQGNPEAARNLARLYHANRLFAEASACYDLVSSGSTSLTARDHYYLADIARNLGDLSLAQEELRAVVSMEPRNLPARVALAEVLLKSGREDAAAREYAAVLEVDPDHEHAGAGLARLELQRGEEDEAVARLEELLAAHPGSTTGAALLAPILKRRGELDRADALAVASQRMPAPDPADPWMNELEADIFDIKLLGLRAEDRFRAGGFDAAESLLKRIEELDAASAVPPLLRGQAEALAHRDEAAVAHFQLALRRGGDPERICPCVTQSLLALGKVGEAAVFLAEHHAKLPNSMPIAKSYAEVLVRQGDDTKARIVLEKVLAREPYLRVENMNLAQILWTAGERDAAAGCLQRVATAYGDDVASRALLGEYFLWKNDPVAAIAPLERAFNLVAPGTPERESLQALLVAAYVGAGKDGASKGRLPEAAEYFGKASTIAPGGVEAWAGLAGVRVMLQDFPEAAGALRRMAALQPDNPTIPLSLGDVLSRSGEADAARRQWQRALELTPPGDMNLRGAIEARLSGRSMGDLVR